MTRVPIQKRPYDLISSIIGTSRGVIVVLPYEPSKPPCFTSPYILEEAYIALRAQQSYLLLAESDVQVPNDLSVGSFGQTAAVISTDTTTVSIQPVLTEFDEELSRKPFSDTGTYSFLATSLLGEQTETDDLVSVIEHSSNIKCMLGQGFTGQHVQQEITDRIRRAAFMLADVTRRSPQYPH
jgi:hypothetical protein